MDALSSLTNPGGGFIKSQDSLSGYSLIQQLWIGTLNTISPLDMYQYNSLAYDSCIDSRYFIRSKHTNTCSIRMELDWIHTE